MDVSSPGIRIGTPDLKMGHRGQITADIVFDGVQVPRANLLGALAVLQHSRDTAASWRGC